MSAQPRVRVRSVVIRVPGAAQDRRHLDSALQTLLPKSKALELVEAVAFSSAVHGSVAQDHVAHTGVVYCRRRIRLWPAAAYFWALRVALEHPSVTAFVVHQPWRVIALVEIFEDAGENFRFLVWQKDASIVALEEVVSARRCEERRMRENILVSGEQSLFLSHHNSDDGAGESGRAAFNRRLTVQTLDHLLLDVIA